MDLDLLLTDPPRVHQDSEGNRYCFQLDEPALRFIDDAVGPESATLETGAGVSTVLFAIKGCDHKCVVPSHDDVRNIREYCAENGVALDRVDFDIRRSEEALPGLAPAALDLVLIDGRHAFPSPMIDWFYAAPSLKTGGHLVVDDTHLWPVALLKEFLAHEPEWGLAAEFARTVVFAKNGEGSHDKWWREQPLVAARSALTSEERAALGLPAASEGGFLRKVKRLLSSGGREA